MDIIICIICGVLIIISLSILIKSIKNLILINKKYVNSQAKNCISNCKDGIFKEKAFFYMQNGGISPCEPINDIEYIDYIKKSSIFVEKKI